MRSQTAIITAPSFTQGAQSCTLGNGCARQLISSQSQPAPRAHNTAPSEADTHAGCSPSCPTPRPRSTTLHPLMQMRSQTAIITAPSFTQGTQSCTLGSRCARLGLIQLTYPTPREHNPAPSAQIHTSTDLIAATAYAEGALHCTLGSRYPANHPPNPSYPTPREHNTAPSDADAPTCRRHNPPNPRPGRTTMHPRRQKPAVTQPAPCVSPALPHPPAYAKGPATAKTDAGPWSNTASEPCGSPPAVNRLNRADHSWKPV